MINSLSANSKVYYKAIKDFSLYSVLSVLDKKEKKEDYEECEEVYKAVLEFQKEFFLENGQLLPTKLSSIDEDELYKPYVAKSKTMYSNNEYYISEIARRIEKLKK